MKLKKTEIRILVVDDEHQMADLLVARLKRDGFEAMAVYSSKDALVLAEDGHYQIVVTDYRMPEMDGLAFIQLLREIKTVPIVIMVTGYGNLELGGKAIRAGAYDFIEKPVDFSRLRMVVERSIEHLKLQKRVRYANRVMWLLFALIPLWVLLGIGLWGVFRDSWL